MIPNASPLASDAGASNSEWTRSGLDQEDIVLCQRCLARDSTERDSYEHNSYERNSHERNSQ